MSSEESYDPEDDKKRKDDKNRKRLNRKIIRKRKRGGPAARARDVALKQQRRNRGEINRSDEYQHRTLQRRAGDVEHTYLVKSMSSKESYDPEEDKKRKDDKNREKATRKILRKRNGCKS